MKTYGETVTIFIAEDHEVKRAGLKRLLEEINDFIVIGETADGASAVDLVSFIRPTVVMMDSGLPVLDGISATKKIKAELPNAKVIMLTSQGSGVDIMGSLLAGVDGYCEKSISKMQLEMAVRTVAKGGAWIDPAVARKVFDTAVNSSKKPSDRSLGAYGSPKNKMPDRPRQVLRLAAEGMSNHRIAEKLGISSETVKKHFTKIMKRLAVHGRTQAVVKAIRCGLV